MKSDNYAQRFYISNTMSAANTLTYKKLGLSLGLGAKEAWVIHRLEYFISSAALVEMTANGDTIVAALTTSDRMTSLSLVDEAILDQVLLHRVDAGTAASAVLQGIPIVKNFEDLPGGGLVVLPSPLYLGMVTYGLASAASCEVVAHYSKLDMQPADYVQLMEMMRVQQ